MVEFDMVENEWGTEAANVTGPGSTPVEGSDHAANSSRIHRGFYTCCKVPSHGQQGLDQEEVDKDDAGGHPCFQCGFFMQQLLQPPGSRRVKDKEVNKDNESTADHPRFHRGFCIQCGAPPRGPHSSEDHQGDKATTDHSPDFCIRCHMPLQCPKSLKGQEVGKDSPLAIDCPQSRRDLSVVHHISMVGPQCSEDKGDKDANVACPNDIRHCVTLHGSRVTEREKKDTDDDEDGFTIAQGPHGQMPDIPKGRQLRCLLPLQRAPAVARHPLIRGPRAVHLPESTLATGARKSAASRSRAPATY